MLRYDFMHASHVRFQVNFLSKQLAAERTTVLGWHVFAAHHVTLQVVFQFERAHAVLAGELRLHAALVLQMAGQRVFVLVTTAAFMRTRPFAAVGDAGLA